MNNEFACFAARRWGCCSHCSPEIRSVDFAHCVASVTKIPLCPSFSLCLCVQRKHHKMRIRGSFNVPFFHWRFYCFKGEILGLIYPIFIPSTFLGVISRVNLPHTLALSDLLHHDFQNFWEKWQRSIEEVNRTLQQHQQKQDSFLCAFWSLFCDYCGILNIVSCGNFWATLLQSHDSKPVTRGEP